MAVFQGRKDLFQGLWIYDQEYDWTPRPVIRLSLASTGAKNPESLKNFLWSELNFIAKINEIKLEERELSSNFLSLIRQLNIKYNERVVILIDDYDAPIQDYMKNPNLADEMRETLKDFYGSLKSCEEERGFVFITGVSRFAKTSLFSGLNNLTDITLNEKYAHLLGFTIDEFSELFKERMEETLNYFISQNRFTDLNSVADLKKRILEWYDGYSWDGKSSVLNPWAVLTFFDRREFDAFWLETGPPSFLETMIKSGQINIANIFNDNFFAESMNIIDIGNKRNLKALLFQTGYLTVGRIARHGQRIQYFLNFPNLEVRASVAQLSLSLEKHIQNPLLLTEQGKAILETLINRDRAGFKSAFKSFLGNFSYRTFTYDENFFSMMFTLAVTFSGQLREPQKEVEGGVMDLHLKSRHGDDFVIEIKYVHLPSRKDDNYAAKTKKLMKAARDKAFQQIERRRYYFCFQGKGNKIFKTALIFGGRSKVLIDFQEAQNRRLEWDEFHQTYSVQFSGGNAE
jgi:hypothetical protein